jgi:L-aspartate semialdehyde sulfurtransferase ferredoxin
MRVAKKIVLHFPQKIVDKPIVSVLIREYALDINILKASISPGEEGLMILEMSGDKKDYEKGVKYLGNAGVQIQSLSQDVVRDEVRCTHCGACVTMCPTQAFRLEPGTRKVLFDNSKCVVCELCVRACPPRAMELHF